MLQLKIVRIHFDDIWQNLGRILNKTELAVIYWSVYV